MNPLYEPPINILLSATLLVFAGASVVISIQKFTTARRYVGDYLCTAYVIRGIRWLIFALTALFWSANFYWNAHWLFIVGLVILAQELYECAFLSAAVREGVNIDKYGKSFP